MQPKELIKSALPGPVRSAVQSANRRRLLRANRGNEVECPVCGRSAAQFVPFNGRPGAACLGCGALERHRMFWLFFKRQTDLFTAPLRVLHIAPEENMEPRLRALPNLDYVTADLLRDDVDLKLDVTRLDLPDESFDVVLCSHVLEHVDDDRLAMRELLRITRRGGWAILTAPVSQDLAETYEDWSITSVEGRLAAFGQGDHVRLHGRNYPDLLRAEGWSVEERPMALTAEEERRYGIPEKEQRIYLGRRPT